MESRFTIVAVNGSPHAGAGNTALMLAMIGDSLNPATDMDLRYYNFMSALVRDNRNSVMKNDFHHWEKLGLDQGFIAYIQQKRETTDPHDPDVRNA